MLHLQVNHIDKLNAAINLIDFKLIHNGLILSCQQYFVAVETSRNAHDWTIDQFLGNIKSRHKTDGLVLY